MKRRQQIRVPFKKKFLQRSVDVLVNIGCTNIVYNFTVRLKFIATNKRETADQSSFFSSSSFSERSTDVLLGNSSQAHCSILVFVPRSSLSIWQAHNELYIAREIISNYFHRKTLMKDGIFWSCAWIYIKFYVPTVYNPSNFWKKIRDICVAL